MLYGALVLERIWIRGGCASAIPRLKEFVLAHADMVHVMTGKYRKIIEQGLPDCSKAEALAKRLHHDEVRVLLRK